MGRPVIVLFDGTWNNSRDRTNVVRLRESIATTGRDDPEQPCLYDAGVGTHWYDRLTGGAFGRGLSENIRQGYAWLSRTHRGDDAIFVLGFSRGAYTARSLVGLIRKCGLVNVVSEAQVGAAYDLYRRKEVHPDDPEAVAFRAAHAREVRVRFLGVWDTVGSLGIPVSHVPFSRDYYRWHDTELSKIVDHAYHAVAVDEHREDYLPTLWTARKPENLAVEQRWFAGAHADVGGGYADDQGISNLPLRWLQDRAEASGLRLAAKVQVGPRDHRARVHDSFAAFMFGLYRVFKSRYHRPFGTGVGETVDDSVWARWREDPSYRPPTLAAHPNRPPDD